MAKLPKTGCKKPSINKIGSELKIITNCTIPKSVVKGTDKGTSTKGTTKKASKSKDSTKVSTPKAGTLGAIPKMYRKTVKGICLEKGVTGKAKKSCYKDELKTLQAKRKEGGLEKSSESQSGYTAGESPKDIWG